MPKDKDFNVVFNQDSRKILDFIPKGKKISTTITSPPYYDMKDYQRDNQVGYGQTYDNYIEDLKILVYLFLNQMEHFIFSRTLCHIKQN